jgi:hypothetical protein
VFLLVNLLVVLDGCVAGRFLVQIESRFLNFVLLGRAIARVVFSLER